ncbi:pogo transposable element, putative [Talaromyces marneffei ATCC 18224]|uniref:Pogo transposable element, putative n=1 Tax=Talaromyces marneffei (strain ATCC 18224 / CBS 334.59 / QM 7333) TaxID=441960 RepID=B6QWH0_TALMQ|nr:pogo transposable element, putative [Talaromyces marneffei ATCC 18224]
MPPIRNKKAPKSTEIEGRILLAISDLKNGRIRSIRHAAALYTIRRTTDRINGIEYKGEKRANGHKLTQFEEDSLLKWVLDLDKRGLPPRPSLVQDMADLFSQHRDEHVSEKWPGNREWVTAIEAVNSTGWALPSYVIFKATTYYQQGWFETLPQDRRLDISKNGWTTDEIGIRWLQKHFIPHTTSRTKSRYRMLILDGHGSHLTAQFDRICAENNIITVCMPPHSSHLLQPLDVSCFSVLKRQYGRLVEQRVRLGFNHIDKYDFLTAFPEARTMAYKTENIQNGFKATGLVPLDPEHVYQKLTIQLRTPTPPPSRSSNSQSSCLLTPQNPRQFKRQITTIKKRISEHPTSPLEKVDQAINRMSKA